MVLEKARRLAFEVFDFVNLLTIHVNVSGEPLCLSLESGEVIKVINLRVIKFMLFACMSVYVSIMLY